MKIGDRVKLTPVPVSYDKALHQHYQDGTVFVLNGYAEDRNAWFVDAPNGKSWLIGEDYLLVVVNIGDIVEVVYTSKEHAQELCDLAGVENPTVFSTADTEAGIVRQYRIIDVGEGEPYQRRWARENNGYLLTRVGGAGRILMAPGIWLRKVASECQCDLWSGCTCGVMKIEMKNKGLFKNPVTGLWNGVR